MSNSFTGGAHEIRMSNGNTSVFVDVMMLAASTTVTTDWGYRFAGRIAQSDQGTTTGLGMAGFALEDFDWGQPGKDAAANKRLVLDTLQLAASRHRWTDLDYFPPLIEDALRRFQAMVEDFDTAAATTDPDSSAFPRPEDVVARSCLRHRVLAPLVENPDCVFCDGR